MQGEREDDWGSASSLAELTQMDSPSPATHVILTVLKAGESVFQTLLLTKTVVHTYYTIIEEHNHCFMHYFGVKTLSETLFSRL